ncbi:MAG TPA: helix-turn-helix domain-containing protein [Gemmatimonadaceae bacterium]|nr:helix-turn-helix domain-containing protein [Gemmatimonadaceae bacterium]
MVKKPIARPADLEQTPGNCHAREMLARVGDKWSMYVIHVLADAGTLRFNQLRSRVSGISQRMLTVTLRGMERDGLVKRTVYPEVPPRVEYTLTPLGATLRQLVRGLVEWSEAHLSEVDAARTSYDARDRRSTKSVPLAGTASRRRSHTSLIAG